MPQNNLLQSPFDTIAKDEPLLPGQQPVKTDTARYVPLDTDADTPAAASATRAAPTRADVIKQAVAKGIDPNLALSIWGAESSSNWNSKDSPKGARGGMQVMPATYKMMMGTEVGQRDAWNNLEAGLRYIAYGQKKLGTTDPELLAAGYHAGYDHADLKRGVIPDTNDGLMSTRDYARKVATGAGKRVAPDEVQDAQGRYIPLSDEEVKQYQEAEATDLSRYVPLSAEETAAYIKTNPQPQVAAKAPDAFSWSDAGSYLGQSLKAGGYDLLGAGAKILDAINPWTLSESDAAVLFKNDPAKLKQMQDESAAMILSRFANRMTEAGEQEMAHVSKSAQDRYGDLKYATTDTGKAAYLSPVKVVSDVVRNLPTMAAMAVSAYFTRGVSVQAEKEALKAGLTAEAAKRAAIEAGAKTMAKMGAATEGAVGYAQQSNQTHAEVAKMEDAIWQDSPRYQQLLADGYKPETAKARITAETAEQAGQIAGIVDATVNKFGGEFLGRIISEGGKFIPRVMKGFAAESVVEGVQNPGEQFGQNWATRQNVNPKQDLTEGLGESAVQGFVVGGVTGGSVSGAFGGRHQVHAEPAARGVPPEVPADAVPSGSDGAPPAPPAAPAAPAQPAPSGPLTAALEQTAGQQASDRITVTAPTGEQASGQLTGYQEDEDGEFTAQIVSDDGEVVTVTSRDGVMLQSEEAAPAGPMTQAVEATAEQAPETWRGVAERYGLNPSAIVSRIEYHFESGKPKDQVALAIHNELAGLPISDRDSMVQGAMDAFYHPTIKSAGPDYNAMSLEDLRARLKYIANQAKASGGWSKMFIDARKQVERAINQKTAEAKEASKPAEEPLSNGPFDQRADANRMMLRHAEATGVPHEVVEANGQFTIQPIKEEANVSAQPIADGQAGVPAAAAERADHAAGGQADVELGQQARPAAADGPASSAGTGAARADNAADAKPALKRTLPETVHAGPFALKTRPIGKSSLWHETNLQNASRLIADDSTNSADGVRLANLFLADNRDIAIGQKGKGVMIEYDGNLVSGEEHRKPGTGDIAGREYKADALASGAIRTVTVAPGTHPNFSPLAKTFLRNKFTKEVTPDGSTVYRSKAHEHAPAEVKVVPEAAPQQDEAAKPVKDAHAGKWFSTEDKARDYITKKKIGDTHKVEQTGRVRYEVKPRAQESRADHLEQAQQKYDRQDEAVRQAQENIAKRTAAKEMPEIDAAAHETATSQHNGQPEPTQVEQAPIRLERVQVAKVESTAQGMLYTARKHKTTAFKRVKDLRQQIKEAPIGGKSALRLELLKAESRWREYQQMERDALRKIEEDAQRQGLTTQPQARRKKDGKQAEQPATTEQKSATPTAANDELPSGAVANMPPPKAGDFVRAPDGSPNFGTITPEIADAINRQAGPIRLRQGDGEAGLQHIARPARLEELAKAGFETAEGFVADVATGFDAIHKGRGSSLFLVKKSSQPNRILVVRLEPGQGTDFYDVRTALVSRPDFMNGKALLWERAQSDQAVAGSPSAISGQSSKANLAPEAKDAKQAAEQPSKAGGKVAEAGEELTYNRRNRIRTGLTWSDVEGMNDALKAKETVKAKVWPKPDYEQMIADGMQPLVAHIVKQVYDAASAKPSVRGAPTDVDFKRYIDAMTRLQDGVMAWASDREAVAAWLSKVGDRARRMQGNYVSVLDMMKQGESKGLLDSVYPDGWRNSQNELVSIGGNKVLRALQPSTDEAVKALKEIEKGWPGKREAWQVQGYQVLPKASYTVDGNGFGKFNLRLNGRFIEQFDTQEQAQAAMDKAAPFTLTDKRGRVVSSHDTEAAAIEAARERVKREGKDGLVEEGMNVADVERTGANRRNGEDVTAQRVMDDFGFRGVNFGKWVPDNERQLHLNHAFDSFHDLAEVLGVPPQAMSLNGMLGIAFGAQGGGKALAHFVPGVNEINITRTNGAGSLAHEFAHALDHYFATQAGLSTTEDPFLTAHATRPGRAERFVVKDGKHVREQYDRFAGVRPEIADAFRRIVETMEKRQESKEEMDQRLTAARERATKRVDQWLAAIRRDFAGHEEKFDAIANRIMAGDLGEGMVKAGKSYLSPTVNELRDLYKQAKGRTYSLDQITGLQSNVDHWQYVTDEKRAANKHEPQKVSTEYARNAAELDKDKGGKGYWRTPWEMFARAFDAYVSDRLEAAAAKNTYLSHAGRDGKTVPVGAEREAINQAFADLIAGIEVKEDGGRPVMYSVAGDESASSIRQLMEDKAGKATIHRDGIGEIAVPYGDKDAGLAHIAARRGEAFMDRLPELLAKGEVYEKPSQPDRIFIGNERDEAVIRKDRDGQPGAWLLTAYEKHPEAKQSRTEEPAPYVRMDDKQLKAALTTGPVGSVIARLIEHGTIVIHRSAKTLPKEVKVKSGMQAVTRPDGTIHLVAGSLTQDNARAVLLHEMLHGGVKPMLDSKAWGDLMGRMGSLYRQAEQSSGRAREVFDRARARVATAKAKGAVSTRMEVEEFAAYAIEEYERAPQSLPAAIRKWVEDLIGLVKAYIARRYGKQLGALTPAQLSGFAKMAVMDMAIERRGEMFGPMGELFSVNGSTTKAGTTNPTSTQPAGPSSQPGMTPPEQGPLRRFQAQVQDNMNRVKQVQERIMELTGRTTLGRSDYYGAETNRPGRIAARLEDAQDKLTGPLMEKLAKAGKTPEQLSELLHAMHAHERNEAVAKINPDMPDGGSGMTDAQANAILARYQNDRELHDLAKEARAISKATLDLKLAYGLIKPEQHELLTDMYEHYVPLKGDGEYGPKVKRAMGHEEREEHILENIARDYDQAVVVGEKNLARQSLLRMVLQFKDDALWTASVPPRGRYIAGKVYDIMLGSQKVASFTSQSQVSAFLEAKGPQAAQYTVQDSAGERVAEFVKPLQDNEVMVYVKGDPVRIQIHDETLARQLRPLDAARMHPILEFMRGTNRYLSKIYTGYSPSFIFRNMARDAMTGTINMLGNNGGAVAAKAWAKYPAAFKAMAQWAATKNVPAGKTGQYLSEYRMHGGKVGASWMSDLEQQGKTLQSMFDDARGVRATLADGGKARAGAVAWHKTVGRLAHAIEIANQASENALRLSLYIALREEGQSAGQAAQAAKQVTVDFDRKGTSTGALGAIYLFFNPAVQGTANAMKTLVKGQHRQQAWAALGSLAMLGVYAASAGMGDDKDRWLGEEWEGRSKNFLLNVGGRQLRVPLSQEFAPVYAFGVALGEAMHGESKMKSTARVVSSFIDAYFPLQGAYRPDSDNPLADMAQAVTPTVFKPVTNSALNRNAFGSQIVPESELTKDRPDNLKMFRATKNSAYDKAAQGIASIGELFGAGKYENDITKVSPESLKEAWRTYTGGLGQFVTDSIGLTGMLATEPGQVEVGDVPIVKDFVRTPDVKPVRGRYFQLAREAHAAITEFEQAKKAGDGEAIDKLMADQDKARLVGVGRMVRSVTQAAAAIGDEKVSINSDQKLSGAEKREKLKAIEQDEERLYRSAIEAFK